MVQVSKETTTKKKQERDTDKHMCLCKHAAITTTLVLLPLPPPPPPPLIRPFWSFFCFVRFFSITTRFITRSHKNTLFFLVAVVGYGKIQRQKERKNSRRAQCLRFFEHEEEDGGATI